MTRSNSFGAVEFLERRVDQFDAILEVVAAQAVRGHRQ